MINDTNLYVLQKFFFYKKIIKEIAKKKSEQYRLYIPGQCPLLCFNNTIQRFFIF